MSQSPSCHPVQWLQRGSRSFVRAAIDLQRRFQTQNSKLRFAFSVRPSIAASILSSILSSPFNSVLCLPASSVSAHLCRKLTAPSQASCHGEGSISPSDLPTFCIKKALNPHLLGLSLSIAVPYQRNLHTSHRQPASSTTT